MMKAGVFDAAGKALRICELPKPNAGFGEIVIKTHACGICLTDVSQKQGKIPSAKFPCIPGHEVTGTVVETGPGVKWPSIGSRVGLPWLYSSCGHCDHCVSGKEIICKELKSTGIHVNGGYAEYVVAPARYVASIPDELDMKACAPLMCAGLTVFNALRQAQLNFGDRVAILGTGGLGQMGVQFASRMGATVAAVSRSRAAEKTCREQGASHYIATNETDLGEALQEWGGANVIIHTAPSAKTANDAIDGLAPDGTLVVLGLDNEPLTVPLTKLIMGRKRVMGSLTGAPHDLRETLQFAADHNIVPQVTPVTLSQAPEILDRMETGTMGGRAVITFL